MPAEPARGHTASWLGFPVNPHHKRRPCTRTFAAYSWIPKENPHPKRRPWIRKFAAYNSIPKENPHPRSRPICCAPLDFNLLRTIGFLTRKFAAYNWIPNENPNPKRRPRTRKFAAYDWVPNENSHPARRQWTRKLPAGERGEFNIQKLHLLLFVLLVVLSSRESKAGSAGI